MHSFWIHNLYLWLFIFASTLEVYGSCSLLMTGTTIPMLVLNVLKAKVAWNQLFTSYCVIMYRNMNVLNWTEIVFFHYHHMFDIMTTDIPIYLKMFVPLHSCHSGSYSTISGISWSSIIRVWMIPSLRFPLLTALIQQPWLPIVKWVSVPSSTNSPYN